MSLSHTTARYLTKKRDNQTNYEQVSPLWMLIDYLLKCRQGATKLMLFSARIMLECLSTHAYRPLIVINLEI